MSKSNIVELRGARKAFRAGVLETLALGGIDLCIKSGEFVSIMGRSGSGKSTLLSILGLTDRLDSGEFILAGVPTSSISEAGRSRLRLRHVGFVFQFFHLIPEMSVEENIALPMHYAGCSERAIKLRVDGLLDRLGLEHRRFHLPSQLSGGQQQRVAIARALANEPDLLLVDEPTGNLDSEAGASVMDLLAEINAEGRTICMVTHDPSCAARATRQLLMRDGALVP